MHSAVRQAIPCMCLPAQHCRMHHATATCCALCYAERGPCLLQMKLLFAMLNEPPWCFFPLTVQLLSSEWLPLQAKCLPPPAHVRVDAAAMEVSS